MTIFLGADHGGFEKKQQIIEWLKSLPKTVQDAARQSHNDATAWEIKDLGTYSFDPGDDYPHYGFAVAQNVAKTPDSLGILICKSGGGVTIAANRVKNARAVECWNEDSVRHARNDNDANILALSGLWLSSEQMKSLITLWLTTSSSNEERHLRRRQQLDTIPNEQ